MYVLKGFVTSTNFINNAPGVTSTIGELSPSALTYAREKGYYGSESISPELTLVTFTSKQNNTNIVIPYTISDHTLTVAKYVYDNTIAANGEVYADELLTALTSHFTASASNFACGTIRNDGGFYIPEWVSWTNTNTPLNTDNQIKIWLVDESFRSQYTDYEIIVIPPFTPLNNFFGTGANVGTALNAATPTTIVDNIQTAKGNYPETIVAIDHYNYVDPLNSQHVVVSYWGVLTYGAAGNNVDAKKDAIVAYILANSSHTREQWTVILPDLFRRTEFILVPLWDQYAIPNRTIEPGIYSPVANLKRIIQLMKTLVPAYSGSHIDNNISTMGHPYKSLSIMAVGGPENRDNAFKITDIFPDYISVTTTSIDFNRMTQLTKDWLVLLADMLVTAETMGPFTSLPTGMTRITRAGVLYLVKNFDNIHYLVAAKLNLPSED